MDSTIDGNERPPFAATIDSILDRYQTAIMERHSAVGALSAIVTSLAPEDVFSEEDGHRLNLYFGVLLDRFRSEGGEVARAEVQDFIRCASGGDRAMLVRFRWDQH